MLSGFNRWPRDRTSSHLRNNGRHLHSVCLDFISAIGWPAAGLCVASVAIGFLAAREPQESSDYMISQALRNGETASLGRSPMLKDPETSPVNAEADPEPSEQRLHIIAWFVGGMQSGDGLAEGPPRYCCHALEAIVNSTRKNNASGDFEDDFHFERLWEVTFYALRPLPIPTLQPSEQLIASEMLSSTRQPNDKNGYLPGLDGLKQFALATPHCGQRRMEVGGLCRTIFADGQAKQYAQLTELAFWNVASLSGKVVRVGSSATKRLSWYRPIHGDLYHKETAWLHARFSPATFHHLFTAPSGDFIEAYQLGQVLPPDAGLQSYLPNCLLQQVNITDKSHMRKIEIVGSIPPGVVSDLAPLGCWLTTNISPATQ